MGFTTKKKTLADVLNEATPGILDRALAQVKLGRMLKPVKVTVAAITAAAAVDITAIDRSKITINQGLDDLGSTEALPPILAVTALRVTAVGTGELGPKHVTDTGGTPATKGAGGSVGVATISDDGKTLTFDGTVTGFVLEYIPRSAADLGNEYVLN